MARGERGTNVAPGIWKDAHGYAVQASVGTATNGTRKQREKRFPPDTKLKKMTDWQEETRVALRKAVKTGAAAGTLEADVQKYLKAVATMTTFKERERDLGLWVAEFPNRNRDSIKPVDISIVLQKWSQDDYAAMTVINRRTALMAVWTVLDGEQAFNPVRESWLPDKPTLTANDIPWPTIEKVLDAVCDQGRANKGEKRGEVSKTKIRLRVIAYTGLPHKLVKQITPESINWELGKLLAAKRRKGSGVDARWLPMSPKALAALRDFVDHDCMTPPGEKGFSNSSMLKSWRKAWKWVHPDWPADKKIPYVYQLRHSFATAAVAESGDEGGTAGLLMHSKKSAMMPRYTMGADQERMEKVVAAFTRRELRLVGGKPTWGEHKRTGTK